MWYKSPILESTNCLDFSNIHLLGNTHLPLLWPRWRWSRKLLINKVHILWNWTGERKKERKNPLTLCKNQKHIVDFHIHVSSISFFNLPLLLIKVVNVILQGRIYCGQFSYEIMDSIRQLPKLPNHKLPDCTLNDKGHNTLVTVD